jgi:hypothetical protein
VYEKMKARQVKKMPLAEAPVGWPVRKPLEVASVHGIKPNLLTVVRYRTWTPKGVLRQISYQAFREDKDWQEVILDR